MSKELFCERHGPYQASAGGCPHCAKESGLPPDPGSLYDDDVNPRGNFGTASRRPYSDDDETELPGSHRRRKSGGWDDDVTHPPSGRILDEEITHPPESRRRRGLLDDEDDIDVTVLDREDTSKMGWLIVKSSPVMRRGHIIKIRPGAIFGRNPKKADILIDDEKISSLHARILLKEDQFVLFDLGSANGTWINGEEVTGSAPIQQDNEIKIGNTIFVVKTLG